MQKQFKKNIFDIVNKRVTGILSRFSLKEEELEASDYKEDPRRSIATKLQ